MIRRKEITIFLYFMFISNIVAQNPFNPFKPETINHWNLKISTVNWESATVKNALEVPYITFLSDLIKGKYNLILNDSPKKIKGVGYHFSTPTCSNQKCSDFYISLITSSSNYFPTFRNQIETAVTKFQLGSTNQEIRILNSSEGFLSSKKQDLKNLLIGYHNDYFLFQNNPYLKNLGIRFGGGVDIYQYDLISRGIQQFDSLYQLIDYNNPSNNQTLLNQFSLLLTNDLNYLEFALKLKLGINYTYEFFEKNLVFIGFDLLYGYGAVSYRLKEKTFNLELINLLNNLNSGQINPLALNNALPKSKLIDGPAFLEIPGYEYYISYGYRIDEKQIIRVGYKYKQEYHNLRLPKIEPDESINLSAVSTGDLTPLILSEIKPQGLLPKNSEFQRDIGIEYMYRF